MILKSCLNNDNYRHQRQERQDELGLNWDTFRHRNYDYAIGRFMGIDLVSEEYMSISTYQFAHNNPVWKIELEGLEGVGKKMIQETMEKLVKNGPEAVSNLKGVLKSAQNTIKGLDDQITSHTKKLDDFIKNPDAFDNKGFLKNAYPELREEIINSRVKSLQGQIDNFKDQKDEITNGVQQIIETINRQ